MLNYPRIWGTHLKRREVVMSSLYPVRCPVSCFGTDRHSAYNLFVCYLFTALASGRYVVQIRQRNILSPQQCLSVEPIPISYMYNKEKKYRVLRLALNTSLVWS